MSPEKRARFCVAVPTIGQVSETFVRSHALDLLPGETVVVANQKMPEGQCAWDVDADTLVLRDGLTSLRRLRRKISHTIDPSTPSSTRESWEYNAGDAKRLVAFMNDRGVEAFMVEYLDYLLPYMNDVLAAGIRWYSFGHGYDISQMLRQPRWQKEYLKLNKSNGVFVRTEYARQRLIKFGLKAELVMVVPASSTVPPSPPPASVESDVVTLLAVGRMVPKKAPLILLESFRLAVLQEPRLRLQYVGGGRLFDQAQAYVADKGLSQVTLHGAKPPSFVSELFATTDIFAQHSVVDPESGDEEGLPASILEAMGRALPVVTTRHAGIPEAVLDGQTGYLVDEGDASAMAERFVQLARDPALRRRLGLAGYESAKERYSWEFGERPTILRACGFGESVR